MTKRDPFPPLASQREINREPAAPRPSDWIGGVALFALFTALSWCVGGLQ